MIRFGPKTAGTNPDTHPLAEPSTLDEDIVRAANEVANDQIASYARELSQGFAAAAEQTADCCDYEPY